MARIPCLQLGYTSSNLVGVTNERSDMTVRYSGLRVRMHKELIQHGERTPFTEWCGTTGVFVRALLVREVLVFAPRTNDVPRLGLIGWDRLFDACGLPQYAGERCTACLEHYNLSPYRFDGRPSCFSSLIKGTGKMQLGVLEEVLTNPLPTHRTYLDRAQAWRSANPSLFNELLSIIFHAALPHIRFQPKGG